MRNQAPWIIGALLGDIIREPSAKTKYGFFFEAIRRRFPLVEVHDATLRGVARLSNALRTIHPNPYRWRERFYKNVPAFRARSRRIGNRLRRASGQPAVVLQLGVLFDACWNNNRLPTVIYTDYTAYLSAKKPTAGRSPFTFPQLQRWMALERQAFERASHVCTRSEFVRASILNDYAIAPERVTVIGGGVNFAELPKMVERPDTGVPTALFIGKEFYRKGGDVLLQAFARVRVQIPEARLLFVTGDAIPSALPLEGVEIIQPTWNRQAIAKLYQRADLFVLPSRLETWGDVLLEAMAYGLPCIGVKREAMEEIIEDGATGLIVPPGDVETLTKALTCLLSDVSLRRQWGSLARQRVEAKYTWDQVVARLAPIIEGIPQPINGQ